MQYSGIEAGGLTLVKKLIPVSLLSPYFFLCKFLVVAILLPVSAILDGIYFHVSIQLLLPTRFSIYCPMFSYLNNQAYLSFSMRI